MPKRNPTSAPRGTRDPERVRTAVLTAGVQLFAERGFAGTSLQNVSDICGVSVGLIQYHFGSKEDLYNAVKEHAMASYVAAQEPQFALPTAAFDVFMGRGLAQYFRFFEQRPTWLRLSAWAALEGDTKASPSENELLDRLAARVRAAQEAGSVRADVDPELLLIIVGGMMQSWLTARERYEPRLRHLGRPKSQEDAYLQLCLDLLRHVSPAGCVSTQSSGTVRAGRASKARGSSRTPGKRSARAVRS